MKYIPVKYKTYGHTRSAVHYENLQQPFAGKFNPHGEYGPRVRYWVSGYVSHEVRLSVDEVAAYFVRMRIRDELGLEILGNIDNDLFYQVGIDRSPAKVFPPDANWSRNNEI